MDCEGIPGDCLVCKGHEKLTELEILEAEGSITVNQQKCLEDLGTLKNMEALCINMLRFAITVNLQKAELYFRDALKGRIKFTKDSWSTFCDYVKECRIYEVLYGLDGVIGHVICVNYRNRQFGWRCEKTQFEVLKNYFQSELHRMVNSIADLMLDEDQQDQVDCGISLYSPLHGNDKGFMNGRLEQIDIEGQNMQVITLGGYFAIRNGKIPDDFKSDTKLRSRCTKISGIHELAATGRAILPVRITGNKHEALLPIPPKRLNSTPTEDKKKTEPVSITLKL